MTATGKPCPLSALLTMKTAADLPIPIVSRNYPASFVVNLKAMPVEKRSRTSHRYRHVAGEQWREWPLCELQMQNVLNAGAQMMEG